MISEFTKIIGFHLAFQNEKYPLDMMKYEIVMEYYVSSGKTMPRRADTESTTLRVDLSKHENLTKAEFCLSIFNQKSLIIPHRSIYRSIFKISTIFISLKPKRENFISAGISSATLYGKYRKFLFFYIIS